MAGEDARGVFNTFDFAEEGDDNKIAILKEKFKQYCEPRKNLTSKKCRNCGGEHSSAQRACPAFGKICHNCRKENHFARVCRSKTAPRDKQAYQVEDIEEDMEEFFIGTVQNASDDDWKENITINNKPVEVKLDTGAQCNMMSRTVYDTIAQNDTRLTTSKTRLVSYSGHKIIPVGKASLKCEHKEATYKITFQIINEEAPSLLGRKTCLEMGMIQRIMTIDRSFSVNETGGDILDHYSDLFTGLGCIKSSGKHHIEVDPNIKSVVHPPRKVPVAIRPRVLQELQRMEELGVIEKQSEPTNWVNSMVTVIKPHKLRICIDPRDLNRAIRREHHPLPTVEEVVSRLPNARIFSILDASSGFWQI